MIVKGLGRPSNKVLAVIMYPPLDVMALAFSLGIASFFSTPNLPMREFKLFWFDQTPLWVGIPFLAIFLIGTYGRVWSRARISEYVALAVTLAGSILLAAGISIIMEQFISPVKVSVHSFMDPINITLVAGHRMSRGLAL